MLNFEHRTGPFPEGPPVYPRRDIPNWYRDAKLGFFVHWGLFTVPAWAETGRESVPIEDAYAHHQYAEWYGNTVRIPNSPARRRHEECYGVGVSYEDLADRWGTGDFDPAELVNNLAAVGGRYLIPTTKHHDGFCLWNTTTTGFNSVARGPRRDLVAELHAAARQVGLKYGVYFSGALDWHVSDFPPIESDRDLFRFRRNDTAFADYAAAQLSELIERFQPDVLWNDIEWPDSGKGEDEFGLAALLRRYFDAIPEGVINDRWGIPHHGFLTREYSFVPDILAEPWEATRGLGRSFGYNQAEGSEDSLSGAELIRLLVDVVSKNGNLLLNVGPTMFGEIPDIQRAALEVLGGWIQVNGAAIYGTRPWLRHGDQLPGSPTGYTAGEGIVNVFALQPDAGMITLPEELRGRSVRWLSSEAAPANEAADSIGAETGGLPIPESLRATPVAVATVTGTRR